MKSRLGFGKGRRCNATPNTSIARLDARTHSSDRYSSGKIQWIWQGWLPRAKLSILVGAGGCGKTTLAIWLAATLSRGGDWPDGSKCEAAGNVIIWSGEDGIADTIIPRLTAANADLTRVHIIEGLSDQRGNRRQFDPAANFILLDEAASRIDGVSLLIFDPLISLIRGDMHRANEVRQGLQMVVDFAERHCCAVLGISHLSKCTAQSSGANRVIGSQAFSALARTVLVAEKDQNSEARVLVRAKSNVSIDNGGIEYFVEPIVIDNTHHSSPADLFVGVTANSRYGLRPLACRGLLADGA